MDAAKSYAEGVGSGDIMAGRAVRLACDRHLKDLKRVGWDPTFPYYYDEQKAAAAATFYPMFLTLDSGEPFELQPWQEFCTRSLFGWQRDGDETRRFRSAYIETGKGSGKTPWLGGVGLYGLVADGEPSAQIFSAATQYSQAGIMLQDAIRMASESADLRDMLEIGKHNIAFPRTHSFFRAVSSEHRGLDGLRPHFALIDELHEHLDGIVVIKMRSGFKRRRQPMEIDITNAGHSRTSVCWEHHQRTIDVLEDVFPDETWFGYICQLDPCDGCFEDGYRQPRDGCSECDDWTNLEVAAKANPALTVTPGVEYVESQIDLAQAITSKRSWVQRLNFCIWTQSHQAWIRPDDWAACKVNNVLTSNPKRFPCAGGLDLSAKLDLTSFVVAVRIDDPRSIKPDVVAVPKSTAGTKKKGDEADEEEPPDKLTLNYCVDLIPFFWLPKETLIDRVRTERIPYDVWEKRGDLLVTLGGAIDYDVIYETIVNDLMKRFHMTALGYDPREATMLATNLRDRGRVNIAELGQGRVLSESLKLLEALIKTRRLRHDGNLVMGWCASNAEPHYDRFDQLWVEKPSGNKRIDGIVAAAMALNQLIRIPKRSRRLRSKIISLQNIKGRGGP